MPAVSVIVPVFNGERFVGETLESVLAQSSHDFELIVVDDGSIDATPRIVDGYRQEVRYICQRNQGVASAENKGLSIASGEYVVFLGADDLWSENTLATLLDFAHARPQAGVVHAWHSYVDEHGNQLPEKGMPISSGEPLKDLAVTNTIPTTVAFLRRSDVMAVGGLDEQLRSREDWDLLLRLALHGVTFDFLPQYLARIRIHAGNKSSRLDLSEKSQIAVLDKFYNQQRLPSKVASLSRQAYATVYLNGYIAWHQAGNEEIAYHKMRQAVGVWPGLLQQEDTYYRLACADQPPGYRATSLYRDPVVAAERITHLLDKLEADPKTAEPARMLAEDPKSRAMAQWTLAWFFHLDGKRREALGRMYQAIRLDRQLLTSSEAHKRTARVVVGYRVTQMLKPPGARPPT